MHRLCTGKSWFTTDALGIGSLLLSTCRSLSLPAYNALPKSLQPKTLWEEGMASMEAYAQDHDHHAHPANRRLAFRECGLSLGLRVLSHKVKEGSKTYFSDDELETFIFLADEIEDFWSNPDHQKSSTWNAHLNINAVTLAASLIARKQPQVFC